MKVAATMVLLAGCILFLRAGATAQNPAPSSPPAIATPTPDATSTTVYTLPPDKLEKSKALYDLRVKLLIVGTAWSLIVLLALLYLGIAAKYRDWAERASDYSPVRAVGATVGVVAILLGGTGSLIFTRKVLHIGNVRFYFVLVLVAAVCYVAARYHRSWSRLWSQALIVVPLFLLSIDVLSLPIGVYEQSISRQYGLSVQGWGSWFGDQIKGEILTLILGTLLLWLMIVIIRKSPKRWWFYFWLIALPILLFVVVIDPIVIDPLFNKFEPLDAHNPQLVDAIRKVSHRGGLDIPPERMFMMKASEKVTTLNAYVTGFGPSKRVVVWDTTIQKATLPETLFVFGHEMGHYVLNHVVIGLIAAAIGLFLGLYLLYRLSGWCLRRFGQRWQIREMGDWAVLPMIFLIFGILSFFATPVESAFSRRIEHNADIYGLEVTHGINANSQEAAAHGFQVLGELSLSYPYPNRFLVWWYADHPPISDRVRFAHEYDPWSKGESPKYVK